MSGKEQMVPVQFIFPTNVWTEASGNGACYLPIEPGEVAILVSRCVWFYNGAAACIFLLSDGKVVWSPDAQNPEMWIKL